MNRLMYGTVAGAVATAAINATTYADMALRGRAASSLPSEVVRRAAEKFDVTLDENRREGLGALSGYAVGLGATTAYAMLYDRIRRAPLLLRGIGLGLAAMALSDVPATRLGATDPRQWSVGSWVSDIVPHVIYGVAGAAVFDALIRRSDGAQEQD